MGPSLLQIILLGLVQGAAELLPVSSSAHVIVAEKLMGLDPATPQMTFLLVMLHTGTMAAVIAYFWRSWAATLTASREDLRAMIANLALATLYTLAVGLGLKVLIEKIWAPHGDSTEIENLFSNLQLVAAALAAAGVVILVASRRPPPDEGRENALSLGTAGWIGAIQGLALPFRGFSRSGSTISVGLLAGAGRRRTEEFSFALAVILTPLAIAYEARRLLKANAALAAPVPYGPLLLPSLLGMVCAFVAGVFALKLLSNWLEKGRWWIFGLYCLAFAALVFGLSLGGL